MTDTADDAPSAPDRAATAPSPAAVLAGVRAMSAGPLTERMGIEFVEASPHRLVATMPVEGNTQPYGLLHGGASCVLAETLGSVGAALHGASLGRIAVGIEINATHHRAAAAGQVTAVASSIHLGGTLASYEIVISDEQGRRICTARLTCLLREAPPG
jgi:1,4-dihydroxy-2-naphthoyl-CoA hydrolase